ncbi:MAG: histidine kinase [Flavobacteriaceae bacterium]|nr:histidine kinase [Flavobacteriaceae bacterium]
MRKYIKNLVLIVLIGTIVFVIGNLIYKGFKFNSTSDFLLNFAIYQLYGVVLGFSNMYFFDYLERIKWKDSLGAKRIIIGLVSSMVITFVELVFLRAFVSIVIFGKSIEAFVENESLSYYHFGMWITMTIVIIFHIIYYYNKYQHRRIKEQKVIAGTASAKFDALKNQLDPHFLFNSLNVLSSLIDENPNSAQKFTTALSKIYRYVLEQKNKELVTLDEELQFAKTYMSLLKMRFEDSIIFEIPEHASNSDSKVVPLSLQLLLENAVKHNMVTSTKPLHIKIFEEGENLVVINNLQPKQILKKSNGVGLENIKQRYELLTQKKVIINRGAKGFRVTIPLLTKQVSVMRVRTQNQYDDSYVRARKYVTEVKEFYYSLISYACVIPFLIFINYRTYWSFQWFWFPMLGWGMGIAFHAYKIYVNDSVLGRSWERRKIEQFMQEEEQKETWN